MYPFVIQCSHMQNISLLPPVPVRFTITAKARVKSAAKRFGLSSSEIIRQAVEQQLPEWERLGSLTIRAKEGL